MESKEPGLGQPEQQELSPFAEKIHTLLQKVIDKYEMIMSQEKIKNDVEKLLYFSQELSDQTFEGLNNPNDSQEGDYTNIKERIDDYISFAKELHSQVNIFLEEFTKLIQIVQSETSISECDQGLKDALLEYLVQYKLNLEFPYEDVESSLSKIQNYFDQIKNPDSRKSWDLDIIYDSIYYLRSSLPRMLASVVYQYQKIRTIKDVEIYKSYQPHDHIRISTNFKRRIDQIKDERHGSETENKIIEAKGLQEPWERQLDPLYEAGILKYI